MKIFVLRMSGSSTFTVFRLVFNAWKRFVRGLLESRTIALQHNYVRNVMEGNYYEVTEETFASFIVLLPLISPVTLAVP